MNERKRSKARPKTSVKPSDRVKFKIKSQRTCRRSARGGSLGFSEYSRPKSRKSEK